MEKQTKIIYILFGLIIISAILHNLISALFDIEEPIFFSLSLLFILGFILSVIYNIITYIREGEPRDLWKLGFLGLLGLIGFHPNFGPGFYGFYGFFGFFGARKWPKIRE